MAVGGRIQEKEKKCRVDRSSITDGSDTCHWNRKEEECFKISPDSSWSAL